MIFILQKKHRTTVWMNKSRNRQEMKNEGKPGKCSVELSRVFRYNKDQRDDSGRNEGQEETNMKNTFGKTEDGQEYYLYTLENSQGMELAVSDYGATLVQVLVPDKDGAKRDVVLGYDDVSGYEKGDKFLGATVGRIANRIGGAQFTLNGKTYTLAKNDNDNNLHSCPHAYNKRRWEVKEADQSHVVFALNSPDGDQGYPGEVEIEVSYTLTEENELRIHYHAVPNQDTIINMTNHSYFNLDGQDSGDILEENVWLNADAYTPADAQSIPTGEIFSVEGTPMDFREEKTVGRDIEADYEALHFGGGYDHNWVLNGSGYRKVARLSSAKSGISMEVYTDLPGMQVYTGNFLEGDEGKQGAVYGKRSAICFETQYFPDAINKPQFESPVVKAGEVYETTTSYCFFKSL